MLPRRVPEGEGFSRPPPPRRSSRYVSPVKDRDDPPPYDSPSHSSSECSDSVTRGPRAKHDVGVTEGADIRPRGEMSFLI
jgi:hypothetical protein